MEERSEIIRDKENEQVYLSLLNNHFKTITYEKHIDAMINIIFTEVKDKVLGKKFDKKRISRKKGIKIRKGVSDKLKHKYGKWVSLSRFKIKDRSTIAFQTNLDKVFRVPGYGTLYGAYYRSACGNIFFTSHALERFEQRTDADTSKALASLFKDQLDTEATSVDLLCGLIFTCAFVYGKIGKFIHLALPTGVLVLEDLGDVFIAKTFLGPDMIKIIDWYQPVLVDKSLKHIHEIDSFATLMNAGAERVEPPVFFQNVKELLEAEWDRD